MDSLETWIEIAGMFCNGNYYDLNAMKVYLAEHSTTRDPFRARFDVVLRDRPLTALDWERRMNTDFEDDDGFYAFLRALYAFLFEDGEWPDGNEF